uniref:Cadherin domain-containing protein n=1 Tax=Panagrellus redivivus TaxID=6233 RepID=A0A7E4VYT2_PANRE
MFFGTVLVCLLAVLGQVSTELVLEKDVTETVTFDGPELEIEVDNSGGIEGRFTLCIKSSDQVPSPDCPTGYLPIQFSFGRTANVKTATVNRQGRVMLGPLEYDTITSILFNENESLDVILKEVPDRSTKVRLLNAVRYVPPESTTTTTEKSSKSATIGITIGIVVGVIAAIIAIAAVIGFCVYCRNKKQKQAVPPPVVVVQKVPTTVDPSPKTSVKTEETKKKNSQEPSAPKPQSPATVPIPVKSSSTQKPSTPSAEPVPPPSAEPASAPPIVNSKEPTKTEEDGPSSKPDKNKSLKVEKTQTETPPSPPTPPFGNDPASKAMSKNSAFKEKADLAFNQTANVNKKKFRFKKCDELFGYELLSENITCYGMRFGRLDRHENFVIRLRCKCRPHEVSDMEKAILKRTKEVAVDAADLLIEHLKKELVAYGKFREDLVILMRLRSTEVLKQAPKDSLQEAAFPLHYQALLRTKNPQSYIEGRSAKTKSMM